MPGTFTCSEDEDFGSLGDNKVIVINGTSGNPADFASFVTADRAGEAVLLAAVAGASGPGNALSYAVRPVEDLALLISCIVAAKTAEADFIFITGTDFAGNAQTESLDVTAGNGTYVATKYFASISSLDCSDNAAGGGAQWADGTIRVTQPQWGLIWDYGNSVQYQIDCLVDIGNGAAATYFTSKDGELVYWSDDMVPVVTANATLQLGLKSGDWGLRGAYWNGEHYGTLIGSGVSTATFNQYASALHCRGNTRTQWRGGTIEILNSIWALRNDEGYNGDRRFTLRADGDFTLKDVFINNGSYGIVITTTPTLAENIHIHEGEFGVSMEITDGTFDNSLITSTDKEDWIAKDAGVTLTVKDPKGNVANEKCQVATAILKEVYTCNINMKDSYGIALQSANIDCTYAHVVEGSDGKTYKCIQDHTAVDATHKPITGSNWPEYWELYDSGGGVGGDWTTGFAYKYNTTEFATQSTDAGGDITEQDIQWKQWTTTSEVLERRLHKFTIHKPGYETLMKENIDASLPLVWKLELQPMRARVYGRGGRRVNNFQFQ